MTPKELERYASAITLSDMEVFIFPELMFSLVLANIMSPRIWKWRDDPWFAGLDGMKPYKRITRLKQYIMDHYAFNLDLDTWGLTQTEQEMARFSDFIAESTIAQSNALFGYEGDKYYFDIDIRTHFGLDKYGGNIIPYWKTETVEAMDAFVHRDNYTTGAGECVSLAALYAAALFIVVGIPLEDIYLMATPLHSQNFVLVKDGILTNNRRLVTKNMWCNGTALSAQARRALENERVTIVSHVSGHIHTLYDEVTMAPDAYERFTTKLTAFLKTRLSKEVLGNFLRQCPDIQKCFQIRWNRNGADCYIAADKAFAYENGSSYRVTDGTRARLLDDIDAENFECSPLESRIVLNDLEAFVASHNIDIDKTDDVAKLKAQFASSCLNAEVALESLIQFCHVKPQLPDYAAKASANGYAPLDISADMGRKAIIARVAALRDENPVADLSLYAYRDLTQISAMPYLKACTERNPVCIEALQELPEAALIQHIVALPSESIYDDMGRLAQPDEVWNFGRGDGLEKAVLLATVLFARTGAEIALDVYADKAEFTHRGTTTTFATTKGLSPQTWTWPLA
ncbi:MAG: hypothetical protein HN341_12365 [Verrucomicrobia bacterium]|jgi:hypothetical protein|nr:hypothetical protein [Verrucomicrobiota bacterium]